MLKKYNCKLIHLFSNVTFSIHCSPSSNRQFTHTNWKYLCSINTTRKKAVLSLMVKLEKRLKPRRKVEVVTYDDELTFRKKLLNHSVKYFLITSSPSPHHPHSQILYKPFVKTSSLFFIAVIPIWNALPHVVVESSNPSIFKQRATQYFLNQ